jgi:ubiquinone/menaquinone biosynthesis C-methylase UbiE
MPKNTERFSDRVDNYIKYRPGYPQAIIDFLVGNIAFNAGSIVADIGSGTGISAEMFLRYGNKAYAVEPNKEMREAADKLLSRYEGYVSINGSSEATMLPDHSIDLVVAAQAFHWFDRDAFKSECQRIGRIGAHCLLLWNERKVASGFEKAYEDLLIRYGNDYLQIDHRNIKEQDLQLFFAPHKVIAETLYNEQIFDYDGVKGRLLSSSYAPNTGEAKYETMLRYLHEIFDKYQQDGKVRFSYDCHLYLGQI